MNKRCLPAAVIGTVLLSILSSDPAWPQPAAIGPAMSIESVMETSGVHPGDTGRIAIVVKLGEGWHVNAHKPSDAFLIPTTVKVKPPEGITVLRMSYPKPTTITLQGTSEPLLVYSTTFTIGIEVAVAQTMEPRAYTLRGTLQYQPCDSKQCLPPKSVSLSIPVNVLPASQPVTRQRPELFEDMHFEAAETGPPAPAETPGETAAQTATENWQELARGFTLTGDTSGYLNSSDFLAFLDRVEVGQGHSPANPLAGKGVWFTIAFVIVGGLLLNLTPCVLPLIPVNLAIIGAGTKARSRWRGFVLGATYGVGIALAYGVLGLVVIVGAAKTFGAINATPWFNGAVAVIFVILALAMFDVFLIDFSRFQTVFGAKRKEGGSALVAFAMGIVAALLAGACVAPVIISTIVYAQSEYARGNTFALALPFLVGVGMALPWPFAGAGLSFLPKPGKWMERVKYALGVIILALAGYFGYQAFSLFSNQYLVDRHAVETSAQELTKAGWTSSLAQGLEVAQREQKPVIIDFWATWCKNCLAMNGTTFKDPKVIARLDNYVKVKFQAEDPNDPTTEAVMEHFRVIGLPTYVTLEPRRP